MIRPFGEAALLVEVADAAAAQTLDAALRAAPPDGVTGTVPGLASVLVEIDVIGADRGSVAAAITERLARLGPRGAPGRDRVVPVVYGGALGPDLPEVARRARRSEEAVVRLHASATLRVLFDGFAPGFAYLGDLPAALRVPRLPTPRTHTPPGSVAIAGAMTGVYPADLPGGWMIIGRTPIDLFDPRREPPAYLAPGDRVRFEPIPVAAWEARSGPPVDW